MTLLLNIIICVQYVFAMQARVSALLLRLVITQQLTKNGWLKKRISSIATLDSCVLDSISCLLLACCKTN